MGVRVRLPVYRRRSLGEERKIYHAVVRCSLCKDTPTNNTIFDVMHLVSHSGIGWTINILAIVFSQYEKKKSRAYVGWCT